LTSLLNQYPRGKQLFANVAKARAQVIETLLLEFDELAAGKSQTFNEPSSFTDSFRIKKKKNQENFLNMLLFHQSTDSDFDFSGNFEKPQCLLKQMKAWLIRQFIVRFIQRQKMT